jgi:hypothetical protein
MARATKKEATSPSWWRTAQDLREAGRIPDDVWEEILRDKDIITDVDVAGKFYVGGKRQEEEPAATTGLELPEREPQKYRARVKSQGEDPMYPFGLGRPMPGREAALRAAPGGGGFPGGAFGAGPTTVSLKQTSGEEDPYELMMIREHIRRMMLDQAKLPPEVKGRAKAQLLDQGIQLAQYKQDRDAAMDDREAEFMNKFIGLVDKLAREEVSKGKDGEKGQIRGYEKAVGMALDLMRFSSPRIVERIEKQGGGVAQWAEKYAEMMGGTPGASPDEARAQREERRKVAWRKQDVEHREDVFEEDKATQDWRESEAEKARTEAEKRRAADLERDRETNLANVRAQIRQAAIQLYQTRKDIDPDYTPQQAWRDAMRDYAPALEHLGEPALEPPRAWIESLRRRFPGKPPAKVSHEGIIAPRGDVEMAILAVLAAPSGDDPQTAALREQTTAQAVLQVQSSARDIAMGDLRERDRQAMQKNLDRAVDEAPPGIRTIFKAAYRDPDEVVEEVGRAIKTGEITREQAKHCRGVLLARQVQLERAGGEKEYNQATTLAKAIGQIDKRHPIDPEEILQATKAAGPQARMRAVERSQERGEAPPPPPAPKARRKSGSKWSSPLLQALEGPSKSLVGT